MAESNDLAEVCINLIEHTQRLAQANIALININAFLMREVCLMKAQPLAHFSELEAELGGYGEAIAIKVSAISPPTSSQAITETYERVLNQCRDLLVRREG